MFRWLSGFTVALLQLGCAEQMQLLDRGPVGGVSPCSFWPPPPGSASWHLEPSRAAREESLGAVASELGSGLREGGYSEQRWYPIGAGNRHGFAVTTRLEQIDGQRWSTLYPDAATLRWLEQARTPTLPGSGRYRVFLISFTDLPLGRTSNAPIWSEETLMDWPNAESRHTFSDIEAAPRAPIDYRFGVYEYEYEWDEVEGRGRLTAAAGELPESLRLP